MFHGSANRALHMHGKWLRSSALLTKCGTVTSTSFIRRSKRNSRGQLRLIGDHGRAIPTRVIGCPRRRRVLRRPRTWFIPASCAERCHRCVSSHTEAPRRISGEVPRRRKWMILREEIYDLAVLLLYTNGCHIAAFLVTASRSLKHVVVYVAYSSIGCRYLIDLTIT